MVMEMLEKILKMKNWQEEINDQINFHITAMQSVYKELDDLEVQFFAKKFLSKLIQYIDYKKAFQNLQYKLYRNEYCIKNLVQERSELSNLLNITEKLLNYFMFAILENKNRILSKKEYVKIKSMYQNLENLLHTILESKTVDGTKENIDLYRIHILNHPKLTKLVTKLQENGLQIGRAHV